MTLALLAGAILLPLGWLVWFAGWSPHSRFLPADGAAWIDYLVPPTIKLVARRYSQGPLNRPPGRPRPRIRYSRT